MGYADGLEPVTVAACSALGGPRPWLSRPPSPSPPSPPRRASPGAVAPNWPTGIALGLGGIAGGYLGARMQSRLPETLIRRTVGILAIAIAAQFLRNGLS